MSACILLHASLAFIVTSQFIFSFFKISFYFTSFILILYEWMRGELPGVMDNDGELNIADHKSQEGVK